MAALWFAHDLIDYASGVADHLGIGTPRVTVTVQPPSVHTRERLMNDRFEQVAWLDEQLNLTKGRGPAGLAPEKPRSGPDPAPPQAAPDPVGFKSISDRDDKPAAPAEAKDRQSFNGHRREQSDYRQRPDPRDWFRAMDSYRDIIRAERALVMLDDRHDMDGNELYLLSFDTTVLAGPRSNALAVIDVTLAPTLEALPVPKNGSLPGLTYARERFQALLDQDSAEIYFDWLERSQKLLFKRIRINSEQFWRKGQLVDGYDDPKLSLQKLICIEWTAQRLGVNEIAELGPVREACSHALHIPHTAGERLDRDAASTQPAGAAPSGLGEAVALIVQRLRGFDIAFEGQFRDIQARAPKNGLRTKPGRDNASRPNPSNGVIFQRCGKGYECENRAFTNYKLMALSNILAMTVGDPAGSVANGRGNVVGFSVAAGHDSPDRADGDPQPTATQIGFSDGTHHTLPNNDLASLECLPAIVELDRLNSDATQIIPGRGERMERFFGLRVGHLPDGSCSVILKPRIRRPADVAPEKAVDGGDRPPKAKPYEFSRAEQEFLGGIRTSLESLSRSSAPNGALVEAFSYSIGPRLRRGYAVERSYGDEASGRLPGAQLGFDQGGSLKTEVFDPEIVGYHPPPAEGSGRAARFGWIIAPQRGGPSPWQRRLTIQQSQLGALVAVPSWLRTVLLKVCTGSAREEKLPEIARGRRQDLQDCRVDTVRLPGNAADVPRRLGVEVVKFPYLEKQQATPRLMAADSDEAARVFRACSAHRSDLMPPTIPI